MHKLLPTVVLIVIIVVLGAGLFYSFIDPYASRLIQARVGDMVYRSTTPDELTRAAFLLSPQNGGGLYQEGVLTYDEYDKNRSIVVDVAKAGSVEAKLLYNPATDTHDVVVGEKILLSSNLTKKFLFISDDGSRVSVAIKDQEGLVVDPASWTTVVIDVATGNLWEVPAFGSVFLSPGTVLAFRAEGVVAVNYETGEEIPFLQQPTILVHRHIASNAEVSKIAWTTQTDEAYVYEIIEGSSLPMIQMTVLKEITGAIALTDENLYELSAVRGGGTELTRYNLYFPEQSGHVRSYPSILTVTKLIP